ncbi:MAG: nuclear transport factor 2 family protein, partial [Dehalococcoidales bacterium]|nr:nuclear transport factor 2 family protein [Dehalococcoidales bacterium]
MPNEQNEQPPAKIREIALALDNAIENKNITAILSSFTNNCEIELLRQQLVGKEGVQKWIDWMYRNFRQIKFQPVILMGQGNILFEEFIVRARLHNGLEIKSKQSEI